MWDIVGTARHAPASPAASRATILGGLQVRVAHDVQWSVIAPVRCPSGSCRIL